MPIILALVQLQQPSTSKHNASKLKEKLKKNKHPLRLSNNSPKPNPTLEKHLQGGLNIIL
jgi:hypothetical protein